MNVNTLSFADNNKPESLASKFRYKRFKLFLELMNPDIESDIILDIGGTPQFWIRNGYKGRVDLLNINHEAGNDSTDNIRFIKGDALKLSKYINQKYDIIWSNSTIEHLGNFKAQNIFANEIRKTCNKYFIQTPNYYFPVEPHYLFPCFQFFPKSIKLFISKHWSFGWYARNSEQGLRDAEAIRLLKLHELKIMFPDAQILPEKFLMLTKSYYIFQKDGKLN